MHGFDPRIAETSNWFNYHRFYDFLVDRGYKVIVEVGCWKGHSTRYLAQKLLEQKYLIPPLVFAVDPFDQVLDTTDYPKDHPVHKLIKSGMSMRQIFDYNLERAGVSHIVEPIAGPSVEVAKGFADRSVDCVFLDGDHNYMGVRADIQAWRPKCRNMLAGHDYADTFPGVKEAVDELVPERELFDGNVWYLDLEA